MTGEGEYLLRKRDAWNGYAEEFAGPGHDAWGSDDPKWGIWGIPESEVRMLDGVDGLDAIELGCGTGYVSAWLARRGARPVGIDNSPKQLETARRLQGEFDLRFPLVRVTPSTRRSLTPASTSRSPSTGRRSGAIRICGSRRRRGSCDLVGASCSSGTRRLR